MYRWPVRFHARGQSSRWFHVKWPEASKISQPMQVADAAAAAAKPGTQRVPLRDYLDLRFVSRLWHLMQCRVLFYRTGPSSGSGLTFGIIQSFSNLLRHDVVTNHQSYHAAQEKRHQSSCLCPSPGGRQQLHHHLAYEASEPRADVGVDCHFKLAQLPLSLGCTDGKGEE